MRVRSLRDLWDRFFFKPESPIPVSLFRVLYGVWSWLFSFCCARIGWRGMPPCLVSLSTMHQLETGARLNLLAVIPQTDVWIEAFFWIFLGSAVFLTIGFLTRFNSVLVYLCLASIQQRNLYITHGGDTFLVLPGSS